MKVKCDYEKCGKEFTPSRSDARFCCAKHRAAQNRLDKKRERELSVRTDKNGYSGEILDEMKALRAENTELKEQVAELRAMLSDAISEIKRLRVAPVTAPSVTSGVSASDDDILAMMEITDAAPRDNSCSSGDFVSSLQQMVGEPAQPDMDAPITDKQHKSLDDMLTITWKGRDE